MSVNKGGKPSLSARVKKQYRGVVGELKKVHWPNKKQLASYTGVVLASVIIMAIALWILDSGVGYLMGLIIN